MSSTSSVCSSNDADFIIDSRIPSALRRDVERFSIFVNRLRSVLESTSTAADGAESACVSVHAALEMVSETVRDLLKNEQFKTSPVILPSLQLVQCVKELKFDTCPVDTTAVHRVLDQLEVAILNTVINRHVLSPNNGRYSTLGRRPKQSPTETFAPRFSTLQRRHSAFHSDPLDSGVSQHDESQTVSSMDRILYNRSDGVDVAFERTKAWSTYCKDLLTYVRARLQLEQDHARRVNALVEASRRDIGKPFVGLREVWEDSFDCDCELMARTRDTAEHLKDRVVEALDARRKEHDTQRGALKTEWTKIVKAVADCEEAYEKARATLRTKDEAVRRAREQCLRTESLGQGGTADLMKRRKEIEKRKRVEEEATGKREEAERHLANLSTELRRKRKEHDEAKEKIIEKLRELVFQCDQTTKACTSHYFKALAALWVKLPGGYQELADATRDFEPGSSYMAYLQHLPSRAASSSSLIRSDRSVDEGVVSCDGSSVTSLRRNALNPDDEGALPDTKRHKKTSTAGRLYESLELSESAQTHCVQRTMQPSKCVHCERLSIVFTVQCIDCQHVWHRNCFPKTATMCTGQPTRNVSIDRRMSIFGVSLRGHLEQQKRKVPLILETTIDELQKRGMRVKGIYRTCGVKSKIEEICEAFERSGGESAIDLASVHPMNLASVIKLYLRKLPEPLLSFDLYDEWVQLGTRCQSEPEDKVVEDLRAITSRLPTPNYETLRHVILHLNRITWFQESNLMSASNLSTVVAPSLCWPPPSAAANDHCTYLQHAQHTNAAVQEMIRLAYPVFSIDRQTDWVEFFSRYSEKPPREDDAGNESDVEDMQDDDGGDIDDDPIFLPQPPTTPDLVKTTRKSQEKEGWGSSPEERPKRRIKQRDQRRSYTTSILISPNSERSVVSNKMKEEDEDDEPADVTVDIAKCQIFVDGHSSSRISRRQSHKEYSSSRRSGGSVERVLSLPATGDLFPGTDHDVSYV